MKLFITTINHYFLSLVDDSELHDYHVQNTNYNHDEHDNTTTQQNRQINASASSLKTPLPYHPSLTKPIKNILASHDIKVTDSSGTNLRDLLTKTKTTHPPHLDLNVICNDFPATYDGQK